MQGTEKHQRAILGRQVLCVHLVHAVVAERHVVIGMAAIVIGNEHFRQACSLDQVLRGVVLRTHQRHVQYLRTLKTHVAQAKPPMRVGIVNAQVQVMMQDTNGIFLRHRAAGAIDDDLVSCRSRNDRKQDSHEYGAACEHHSKVFELRCLWNRRKL